MRVAIIGQGYVGLTIAADAAASGHHVVGYDVNPALVSRLNAGVSHIEGISEAALASVIASGAYKASTDPAVLDGCDVIVIAVPTPLDDARNPDLSFVHAAADLIAQHAKSPALIVNESTSYPGTLRKEIAARIPGVEHLYASSPERVDPGNTQWGTKNTPRLIGGMTPAAVAKAKEFYGSFCDSIIEVSSPEVAEAAKLFENTFRQVNIALVNEFAQITHALGISVYETLDAANTKPYGFMKFLPGAGVGGHCIPVDPSYLLATALDLGVPAKFINLANETNLDMANYVIKRVIEDNPPDLKGKKVQIIGVSYKSDVADTREAPAGRIIDTLRSFGANVDWHDPLVDKWRGETSSPLGASDISILVTRHAIFSNQAILDSAPYVFDTTGVLDGTASL